MEWSALDAIAEAGDVRAIVGGVRETLREMMERRRSTSTGPPRVTWFPKHPAP